MQFKTILNHVTNYKPFVIDSEKFSDDQKTIEVTMRARSNSKPRCLVCDKPSTCYDTLPARRFDFIPLWMTPVVLTYARRRVNCQKCGVKVEWIPWATGKNHLTTEYQWFLAGWAPRMSWKEVASSFGVSWDHVFNSIKHAVSWGLEHRSLEGVGSIGVDEVQWKKGHKYQTLVYQIDQHQKRLLWIGPDRTAKTLLRFFRVLGKERTKKLQFIYSDMWQAYLKVIAKKASQAIHVLDRFHVVQKIGKAIDKVRAAEVKQLRPALESFSTRGARARCAARLNL